METSEKVSIFAGLNVKGGIPSPLHNPPMRVDTLSGDFVYSLRDAAKPLRPSMYRETEKIVILSGGEAGVERSSGS